jgi:UDP-N-acetylmuramoylalanine--D-glutamate ligase
MEEATGNMSAPTVISSTRRRVVVGLGVTGLSVARHLARRGETFSVVDSREQPPGLDDLRRELPEVPVLLGDWHQSVLDTAGELVVSPGLSPQEPALARAVAQGAALCGDIDLFVAEAQAPVVGITGSNAKSTVTALVGAMAEAAGRNAGVGGNLGTPALDLLDARRDLYVLELSSFQLERAGELGLEVAAVLNLTPDHLDRHGTLQRYHQAKHRIFNGCRTVVFNADDPLTIPPLAGGRRQLSWRLGEPDLGAFGLRRVDGELWLVQGFEALLPAARLKLPGRHNLANALAALAIGHAAGLERGAMVEALQAFTGLPHRCQLVTEAHGVRWVDDSKATNVGAALAAIEGLGESQRLLLIAGGRDKGADFRQLVPALKKYCDAVLLIGEAAEALQAAIGDACPTVMARDLDSAVAEAARRADPGQLVLLSPACASFDQFKDYRDRGAAFARAVLRELQS